MQLTIDRATFLRPLGHLHSVVERRNTTPILVNVLLDASGGQLELTATDTDMQIVEAVDCVIGEPGAVTVPAQTVYDIMRKMPDGSEVRLETDSADPKVVLSAGRSTFTLPSLPAGDFPVMKSGESDEQPNSFILQAADIRSVIDRTRFAIANDETRLYLNGIYIHATQVEDVPVMRFVATDGHRLARVEIPLPEGAANMPDAILPRKAVGELRKLLDDAEDDVAITVSKSLMKFEFRGTVFTTKLVEGTYPDYNRVIPSGNDKTLKVDRRSFANAVDRVSTVSTEKSRSVKLELNDSLVVLSASSQESGMAREEIEASYDGGGAMAIGFNAHYLLDIANQVEGDGTVFKLADSGSPAIIRDIDDDGSLYVIMPMRV